MKITLDSIFNVDRRIVFVFVFLALLIPLLFPYAMPCKATRDVLDMYGSIETAMADNKPIFISFEWEPTGAAEHEPMARSIVRHIFSRDGKIVVMCKGNGQLGEAMHLQLLEDCAQEYGKNYGADYVYLAYKPGSSILVINLGESLQSAWPKDSRGEDLDKIPLTRGIGRLSDFGYHIVLCAGLTSVVDWITYGQSPYNLKMGFGVLGNVTPDVYNYVQSGQVVGLLGGLIGAAQYEQLIQEKGIGEQRRFSTADLVRSRVPALCQKLADPAAGPVAAHIFGSLPEEARQAVRETARLRLDKLSMAHKRALVAALNEAVASAEVVPAAALEAIRVSSRPGAALGQADLLRIKRRAYVESLFPDELVKANAPGRAMRWMTPQSVAHLALIGAIIFGNTCYFIDQGRRRKANVQA